MKETLQDKEAGNLGVFISERQRCISKIEWIDGSIRKITKEGPDEPSHISDKCKGLIDGYLKDIRGLIKEIDLIDRELMVTIKEEGEGIKTELLKLRNIRQAATGYKRQVEFSPRFLDTKR